jgi:2'-5' RNA ligase
MAGFIVEFRMHGYAKEYAKEVVYSVARKFRVKGVTRKRVVPHICLYGPGRTSDIRKVISAIERVGRKYTLVPFEIKGFGFFDKSPKVIYFDIRPSRELEELRWELSQELRKISSCQPWDAHRNHHFHATIAFKDIDAKFSRIWSYLESKDEPQIQQYLTRITVVGAGRRIVCEYDLVLRRLLTRREALSKRWGQKTVTKLRELQGLPPVREPIKINWLQKFFKWLSGR